MFYISPLIDTLVCQSATNYLTIATAETLSSVYLWITHTTYILIIARLQSLSSSITY